MKPRVLVVEDDAKVLSALARGLALEGYEVDATEGGAAALALAQAYPPQVVVLDVMLPGMNGEIEVSGDAERLRQVLRNVIGNALRHTPPGTHVRLALRVEGGLARVVVEDDGPGIAPEHLPHVFDRFYRADTARSRSAAHGLVGGSSGAGLGLAIAKHLVEAHDGAIRVQAAPQRGTKVEIDLPQLIS